MLIHCFPNLCIIKFICIGRWATVGTIATGSSTFSRLLGGHQLELRVSVNWKCGLAPIGIYKQWHRYFAFLHTHSSFTFIFVTLASSSPFLNDHSVYLLYFIRHVHIPNFRRYFFLTQYQHVLSYFCTHFSFIRVRAYWLFPSF